MTGNESSKSAMMALVGKENISKFWCERLQVSEDPNALAIVVSSPSIGSSHVDVADKISKLT